MTGKEMPMPVAQNVPTKQERRAAAALKIKDARPTLMAALTELDAPGLAREHWEFGAIVLALDDLRSSLTRGQL